MVRTLIVLAVLFVAVFWLPLWVQLALFAVAILIDPNRFFAVVPAIVSDALYAPGSVWNIAHHWMTLLVLGLLLLHYVAMKLMRVRTLYGLEA